MAQRKLCINCTICKKGLRFRFQEKTLARDWQYQSTNKTFPAIAISPNMDKKYEKFAQNTFVKSL